MAALTEAQRDRYAPVGTGLRDGLERGDFPWPDETQALLEIAAGEALNGLSPFEAAQRAVEILGI